MEKIFPSMDRSSLFKLSFASYPHPRTEITLLDDVNLWFLFHTWITFRAVDPAGYVMSVSRFWRSYGKRVVPEVVVGENPTLREVMLPALSGSIVVRPVSGLV